MAFFKGLFTGRSKKGDEQEQQQTPVQPEEAPVSAPAPEPVQKTVTSDMIADNIEIFKGTLENYRLSREEIDNYCASLIAMQQAIRGLHANLDVTDLMDYLNQVFASALFLIFSGGTPIDRNKALLTASDAIKAIPSVQEAPIKIATLQLAMLIQSALIISSRKTISDLMVEKAQYQDAEKDLMKNSGVDNPVRMKEFDKITFEQYELQIQEIEAQVQGAERLISSYNQEIVSMKGVIRSIQLNPNAVSGLASQEKMKALREKMPSLADFINMVDQLTQNADDIRARTKASIKELRTKLEDTAYIPDPEMEEKMNQLWSEIQKDQEETAAQEAPRQAEPVQDEPLNTTTLN